MLVEKRLKRGYIGEDIWEREPTANTVGYWELNGDGRDTKNDYDAATYTTDNYNSDGYTGAGTPTYTEGRRGKLCAYFTGDRCLNLPVIPIPSNTATFSARVKPAGTSCETFFQLRKDMSSSSYGWAVLLNAGNGNVGASFVACSVQSGTTNQTGYGFDNVAVDDGWHNIIFTFNGGAGKFYVDAVLKQTINGYAWLRNGNSSPSYIGGVINYGQTTKYTTSYVQDIIYENATRSDAEILKYYNAML